MKNPPNQLESRRRAFTLIELLVVISIIAVLAAFLIPTLKGVKNTQLKKRAAAELAQVETAIERYKAARGFYPPSNTNSLVMNQLFYELNGVSLVSSVYQPLGGTNATIVAITASDYASAFNVGGLVNSSQNGDADSKPPQTFLAGLRPDQVALYTAGVPVTLLVCSVSGAENYRPLGQPNLNPWRYNSANPTNNPGEFDLYVDLVISGKTNRISNWSKQPQIIQ